MTDSKTETKVAVKTVADDMDSRRVFANVTEATAYLQACGETLSDFGDIALASVGVDSDGNFDPAIYTDEMGVMISTLRKAKEGVKAIVIAPIPTLESLLKDDSGKAWVERILHKELNHVAVRALREAEDISTVLDQMPANRDAYISSARGEGGGILETYNELYKAINATLSSNSKVWEKARLTKLDLKKSLESAGFAVEYYPMLENRGEGKDSLFKIALQLGIAAAKKKGLDATIFERWAETRDAKTFKPGEEEDFDVDSLTSSLLEDKAKPTEAKSEEATTA